MNPECSLTQTDRTTAAMRIIVLASLLIGGCGLADSSTITERMRAGSPQEVRKFLAQGQHAYERGTYTVALAMTDSVEAIMPELADLHFLRGKVYTQLNQLDLARAAYEIVLALDPKYGGARFELGLNNFRRGHFRDAISFYMNEREIEETAGLMHELGRAYVRMGEADSARIAYEAAITLDPAQTMSYMWLGQLLEESGEMEEALRVSLQGLALRPDDLDYQYIVGTQLLRTEDPAEAVQYLEPVAREWPWHHGAQFNLGQVYMRLGMEESAQTYFARADSAQQLQQQVNEAQDAISNAPDSPKHWLKLANLLRQSGQYNKAVEAYKNVVTIFPFDLTMQVNLATLYIDNGQYEDAIGLLNAILRADPSLHTARLNIGVAYITAGDTARARVAWEQLLAITPEHAIARQYLAELDSDTPL